MDKLGGKSNERFDAIAETLERDFPGHAMIEWRKLFEEDREFNQGEFAECIRDQFLKERIELFDSIGATLYDSLGAEKMCSVEQTVKAILQADPDTTEEDATNIVSRLFDDSTEKIEAKIVMKKLAGGILKETSKVKVGNSKKLNRNSAKGGRGTSFEIKGTF